MEAFADHFNLRPLVRFNTHVVRLDHAQQGRQTLQEDRNCCSSSTGNGQKESTWKGWTVVSRPADSADKVRGLSAAPKFPDYLEAYSIEVYMEAECFVSELTRVL